MPLPPTGAARSRIGSAVRRHRSRLRDPGDEWLLEAATVLLADVALLSGQEHESLLGVDLRQRHRLARVVGLRDQQQVHAVGADVALEVLLVSARVAVRWLPAL